MSTSVRLDIDAIGRRAAARREELHLEQEEVAIKAGMSRAYVSPPGEGRSDWTEWPVRTNLARGMTRE